MVVRIKARREHINGVISEERSNSVEPLGPTAPGNRRRYSNGEVSKWQGLVNVDNAHKMCSLIAKVANANKEIVRDLALSVEAPFLDVRLLPAPFLNGQCGWKQIDIRRDASRIIEDGPTDRDVIGKGGIRELTVLLRTHCRRVIEDSVACANGRFTGLEWIPSDANARRKIFGVVAGNLVPERRVFAANDNPVESRAGSWHFLTSGRVDLRRLGRIEDSRIEAGGLAIGVGGLVEPGVTHAVSQREVGLQPEGVLREPLPLALANLRAEVHIRLGKGTHVSQEEIGPLLFQRTVPKWINIVK